MLSRLVLRRRRRLVMVLAIAGLVLPLLVDALVHGGRRVYDYFVADAFAYLTVARNGLSVGHPSFDQLHPTNGFHPLWQALLLPWVGAAEALGVGHMGILWSVFALGLVFSAAGIALLLKAATHRRVPRGELLLVVAGITSLTGLLLPLSPTFDGRPAYASTWAVVNGMETSLVVFFFGLCAWLFVRGAGRRPDRAAVFFGLAATGLALARLDHAIFGLCFVVAFFARAWMRRDKRALLGALLVTLPLVVLLGVYIAYNINVYGSAVPVSGRVKSSYPYVSDVHALLVAVLRGSPQAWSGRMVRLMSLLVPLGISALYVVFSLRARFSGQAYALAFRRRRRFPLFLWLSALGAVGLGFYNFLFVPLFAQGTWYFPASNLVATLAVAALMARTPVWRRWTLSRPGFAACSLASLALCALSFVVRFTPAGHHADYAKLDLEQAPRAVAFYRASLGEAQAPYFLSFDDGIVAWSLPYPVMSRSLLLDTDAFRTMRREKKCVLEVALDRGFNRVTSLDYWNPKQLKVAVTLKRRIGERTGCGVDVTNRYRMTVEHLSDDERFMVVHIQTPPPRPRPSPPPPPPLWPPANPPAAAPSPSATARAAPSQPTR